MSTYTDLHNRVQESINVDYSSRITPQKVIFMNEENEYWGTFNGKINVDSIDVNGGTLSGVTLKDVAISGATFKNVDGLNIDLDDYISKLDFLQYLTAINNAAQNASTARDAVHDVSVELNGKIDTINSLLANSTQSTKDLVDSGVGEKLAEFKLEIGTTSTDINLKINTISTILIPTVSTTLTNIIDALSDLLLDADETLSNNLTSTISATSSYIVASINDINNNIPETITTVSNDLTNIISSVSTTISNDLTDDVDLLTTTISTISSYLTDQIDVVSGNVINESTTRETQDTELLRKINNIYNADENTGTIVTVSNELSNLLSAECKRRDVDDLIISSSLTNLYALHNAEIENRGAADNHLQNKISLISINYLAADVEITNTINLTSTLLDNKIDKTSADVLAELEYKRHYILNTGIQGQPNDAIYPLIVQDMAVNVFDVEVPDAKVVYEKNSEKFDVARIKIEDNTLKVKTYADLSSKNEGLSKALQSNHTYEFTRTSTQEDSINGYTFEYLPPANQSLLLSPGKLFELHATLLSYYNLILNGTLTIIGKVYATSCNEQNAIVSGKYDINVPSTSELALFNKHFKDISYSNINAVSAFEAQRITYMNDDTFKLELGVHSIPYFDVKDTTTPENKLICRVYKKSGNEDGLLFNDDNELTSIRINDIEDDSSHYAYLNTSNGFSTIISTYTNYTNKRIYNRYIDAKIEDNMLTFLMYDAARLNKYPFVFTSFDSTDDLLMTGYVVPIMYNKTIEEAIEQGGVTFSQVKVDLRNVVTVDRLKKEYTLTRPSFLNKWSTHESIDGAIIDIVYSDFNILSVHYNLNAEESGDEAYLQNDFTHVFNVSRTPEIDEFEIDPDAIIREYTATINLNDTFINESIEPTVRDYVEKTYYASFDSTDLQETSLVPYDLDVVLDGMDNIEILLPTKLNYDPKYQISREFLLVLRFRSNIDKEINVILLKPDGKPATFYNNKLQEIGLPTNQWTTLQINEVQEGKYLVTDLNLNEDRLRFRELAEISADHENRISDLELMSADHDAAIDALSDAMHFKGDVCLKSNYGNEHETHTHLSMLVETCNGIDEETTLERGYTFRCTIENGTNPLSTYVFKDTNDGNELKLNNNDYIILAEDGKLSDINVDNVVVVKDYNSHITNLSTASDGKYFINATDNTATGTNTFEGRTLASALTAAELSAAHVVANILKIETAISVGENIVADTAGLTAGNLSAENLSADSFIASNLTASGITAGSAYLSDELSVESLSATSANINIQLVESAISISNNIVADTTGLTADNLSAGNLTVDNKVVVAENLSVDENGLSAKNFVATADGISASGLSAPNLKVETVAADSTGLSANAISTTTLSASDSIIIDGKLTATDDGLIVNGKLSTNNDLDIAGNLSVGSSMLSAKGISADENGISTSKLEANAISVAAWSNVSAVVDDLTTTLNNELTAIKSNVSTISGVVDGALSGNVELPEHLHTNPNSTVVSLTATVSKLIIIDEKTYDKYALTIRNGALNIDKIGHYNGNNGNNGN